MIFKLGLNSHNLVQIGTGGRIIVRSPPKKLLFHAEQLLFYEFFWLDCTQQRYCRPKDEFTISKSTRSSVIWPQIQKCYSSKSVQNQKLSLLGPSWNFIWFRGFSLIFVGFGPDRRIGLKSKIDGLNCLRRLQK